jgi:hypothetical protein
MPRGHSLWATAYGNDGLDQIGEGFIVSPAPRDPAAVAGPHRQATKPEPARQCVDAALGQVHMKPRLDHAGGSPAMPGGT